MKKIITATAFVLISFLATLGFAQTENHSRVRIYTNDEGLRQLSGYGIPIDHGTYRRDAYFESDFSETEIQIIEQNGFNYDILIQDVAEFYKNRSINRTGSSYPNLMAIGCDTAAPYYPTPSNFTLGTMGGFFKYAEFIAHIDNMFALYPNLITQKQQIGAITTYDGYPIYWLKISDNPTIDETEPEVLYNAVHHAREPQSMTQMIFYMYYLLENYGSDPEVTYLVDNTEMYFIPLVNPDGYVYNETNNPNGGGMWRKNRRNNGGSYGVDLNRNYGYNWGYDNIGSSPTPTSNTYRGPSAFSEPETQAVKFFEENREIKIVLNYHAYGNLHIYPWGYEPSIFTPDSALHVEYAKVMTIENGYSYGTGDQTVGYVTNGDADDWMYGEQISKGKIMAVTPEVGNSDDGFWPLVSRIIPICNENMRQNLNMAHLALKYAIAEDLDSTIISQQSGYFNFEIMRLGLDSPATFTVDITPLDAWIQSVGSPAVFTGMTLLEKRIDSISYTLNPTIVPGQEFRYLLSVDNGTYAYSDTITKVYGQTIILFTENGNAMTNWTTASWGVSNTIYYSPTGSITDTPFGDYQNNTNTTITLNNPIDLSNTVYVSLYFMARWEIEAGYDYVEVMASDDGGNTWSPLCGKYTKPGTSNQDLGNPLYDGFQQAWVHEEVPLNDYLGQSILLRFKLKSDVWTTEDGYFFDDMDVIAIPYTILTLTTTATDATCLDSNGTATAVPSGGLPPFTYLWDDLQSQTTVTATGLLSGIYNVTVTDAWSNTETASVAVNDIGGAIVIYNATNVTCGGGNDGTINLTITGTAPFTFIWSNTATTEDLSGLTAGAYLVTVTDSVGCQTLENITITEPPAITTLAVITQATGGNCNGEIALTPSGGTPGYTYLWDVAANSQTTATATALCEGNYCVTITDALGCTFDTCIDVTVGIDEYNLAEHISIFPNPNSGQFTLGIDIKEKDGLSVRIVNILGQEMLLIPEEQLANNSVEIDLTKFAKGVYCLQITTATVVHTEKVVYH